MNDHVLIYGAEINVNPLFQVVGPVGEFHSVACRSPSPEVGVHCLHVGRHPHEREANAIGAQLVSAAVDPCAVAEFCDVRGGADDADSERGIFQDRRV